MTRRSLSLFFTAPAVLMFVAACGDRPTPEAETASASSEYPREVLQAHMQDHFFKATEMQVAVVNGDLAAVREPARWMAEHANSAAMPADWSPYAEAMHAAANRVAEASDLASAAMATAAMGAECGNCHKGLGAEVGFAVEAAPPQGEGASVHMSRHAWASGRMWEGLIAPSGVVWHPWLRRSCRPTWRCWPRCQRWRPPSTSWAPKRLASRRRRTGPACTGISSARVPPVMTGRARAGCRSPSGHFETAQATGPGAS